jgi:hypothetical protein
MSLDIGNGINIENGISIRIEYPSAPYNVNIPVITGVVQCRNTINTTLGNWVGVPYGISYNIQWQHGIVDIIGAASSSLTIPTSLVGQTLRSKISAYNTAGATVAYSENTINVLPNIPLAPTIGTAVVTSYKTFSVSFTPNDNGGELVDYYTVTSSDGSITRTGTESPINITIPVANIYNYYQFNVTATNPIGTSDPSANSNSVKSEPNNGDNLGGDIGYYVGQGTVISGYWSTNNTWTGCNNSLINNVNNHSTSTGPYRWPTSTQLQIYRTSGGGVYLKVGGPFWTGTSTGASLYYSMNSAGTLTSSPNARQ